MTAIDSRPPTFQASSPMLVDPGDQVRREAITRFNDVTRAWADQMLMMRRIEADLGVRLAACRTPAEAVALSGEWMARRIDSLVALQHRIIDLWLAYNAEGLRDVSIAGSRTMTPGVETGAGPCPTAAGSRFPSGGPA